MQNTIQILLGDLNPTHFLAAYIFGIIGVILGRGYQAMKRDPHKAGSPVRFSWVYWLQDNAVRVFKRLAWTLLVLFVGIRFAPELIGSEISVYAGLLVGLGIDQLPEIIQKKKAK